MAKHLIAAIDEDGAEKIVSGLVTGLSDSKSSSAFGFSYNIAWEFLPGSFELVDSGDIIRLRECDIHTDISFGWSFDLSNILPDICFPRICFKTWFGKVCTPRWCIDWPTISVPFSLPTLLSEVSFDFSVQIQHDPAANQWVIKAVVNPLTADIDIIDVAGTAVIAKEKFEDSLGIKLSDIPFIGSYLNDATDWILSEVLDSIDDLLEFLSTWLSDSLRLHPVLGIGFELHRADEIFEILPTSGTEPAVMVRIIDLDVDITSDRELVVSADIAVP